MSPCVFINRKVELGTGVGLESRSFDMGRGHPIGLLNCCTKHPPKAVSSNELSPCIGRYFGWLRVVGQKLMVPLQAVMSPTECSSQVN